MSINDTQESNVRDFLKSLSQKDFLQIGMHEIAYVRMLDLPDSGQAFAIYAADGTQLSVLGTMDMAMATLRHNDLVPVTLH